jgi:DNA-binding NarL/FixJ family response regulator
LQHHRSPFSEPALSTEALTTEELRVLELVCVGKTSGRISQDLGISFQSTTEHRMRIMQKMATVRVLMAASRATGSPRRVEAFSLVP